MAPRGGRPIRPRPARCRRSSDRGTADARERPSRQRRGKTATCTGRIEEKSIMTKPVKTEAELIAMARAELKVHADGPDGMVISVIRDGDTWEFRASADEAIAAKPGYPEAVAMLVQIGDHLSRQYDLKG